MCCHSYDACMCGLSAHAYNRKLAVEADGYGGQWLKKWLVVGTMVGWRLGELKRLLDASRCSR